MRNNVFRYYVDYYCKHTFQKNYQKAKERELKKFNVHLSQEDYLSTGGYADSFVITDYIEDRKLARKYAKKLSQTTTDLAFVRRDFLQKDEFGDAYWEYDEDYCDEFCYGKEL